MRPLSNPKFYRVRAIRTRPGITVKMPRIWRGMCWGCTTEHGCKQCEYFTCPSCRRMVPWSSGGTDSLDCADCWALTEREKTMEEKPEEQNKEAAPKLPKGPYVKTLWMLRAFDRNGNEDNRGDNQEAMAVASQLEATLEKGPASGVILIRDDLDDGSRSTRTTPTVVAFRTGATTNEVVAILRRAIDIALGKYPPVPGAEPPKTDQEPMKGWEFPSATHEWAEKMRAKELADKVRSRTIQAGEFPGKTSEETKAVLGQTREEAEKIIARQQPAYAIGATLAGGVIRGSKIKSGTKALEKIIARQAQRIEELAMQVGKLESINRDHFQTLDDVLKAAGANGISQVLSILVAVKAGKPVPEVSEMPEFPSRSTTFYMTKP